MGDNRFENALQNSTVAFNGLMVLGFLGIVWLMIFGNLSGNLGFGRESVVFSNETLTLTASGSIPPSAQGRTGGALSSIVIFNNTAGTIEPISSGNYSISGVTITDTGGQYNETLTNVSGIVTFDSTGKADTDSVIQNLTQGAKTFFSFSNTLFTIIAIVLLITILLALLFVVMNIVRAVKVGKSEGGFSE